MEINAQDFSKVLGAIGLCTQYFANRKGIDNVQLA